MKIKKKDKLATKTDQSTTHINNVIPPIINVDEKDGSKNIIGRFEFELFKEEDDKIEKVYRVKRITVGNIDKWKFFEDNKCTLTFDSSKFSNEEKEFLKTVEGFQLLTNISKRKISNIIEVKEEVRNALKK